MEKKKQKSITYSLSTSKIWYGPSLLADTEAVCQNILQEDSIPWTGGFIHLFIVLSKTILDKNSNS